MITEDKTLSSLMELVNRIRAGEEKSVTLAAASKAVADYIIGEKSFGTEVLKSIAGKYGEEDEDENPADDMLANELQDAWMNDEDKTLHLMAQILAGVAGNYGLKDLSMVAHGIWLDT